MLLLTEKRGEFTVVNDSSSLSYRCLTKLYAFTITKLVKYSRYYIAIVFMEMAL